MSLPAALSGSANSIREAIAAGRASPAAVREALAGVPAGERDAWLDAVLGLGEVPGDSGALPRGCVPYLPCPVDAIVELARRARLGPEDVLVDVGSGVGRAMIAAHLVSGCEAIGIEIQPHLAEIARATAARLGLSRCTTVLGDAALLPRELARGTVLFLYCPFGGERVARVLDALEPVARSRRVRVCTLDLPLPPRAWLRRAGDGEGALDVYESA